MADSATPAVVDRGVDPEGQPSAGGDVGPQRALRLERALAASDTEGLVELDLDGGWREPRVSPRVGVLGVVPAGGRWVDLFEAVGRSSALGALAQARAGQESRFQARLAAAARPLWVDTVVLPVRDEAGGVVSLLAVSREASPQHERDHRRIEAEDYLRAIIDTEPECVKVVAPSGALLEMNPAGLAMIEAPSLAAVSGAQVASLVAPEDRDRWLAMHRQVCAGQAATLEFDIIGLHGTRRRLESHAVPLPDRGGVGFCHLAVTRDVTERRATEQALRESEARLRQSQKLEGIGQLAGGIAHDFNNLLTAIGGFSAAAASTLSPDHPAQEDLEQVRSATEGAAALTRQLLAFSRRQLLAPAALNPNQVITELSPLLRRLLSENIQQSLELDPDIGTLRADRGQLQQVLLNLAVNSRDAMPSGGRLLFSTRNETIAAPTGSVPGDLPPGRYVVLTVTDTGHGMDAQTQARIFEPFFSTKGLGRGTGLGLATVYGIVQQSQAHIRVQSAPGQGASFRVYFPRVEGPPDAVVIPARSSFAARGAATVLVVEDDPSVRRLTTQVLRSHHFRVLEAASGEEALHLAEGHAGALDLLLTDVVMPGMNGRELATRLQARRPETAVVYMSGYTDDEVVRTGVLAATTTLLPKPFGPEALVACVQAAIAAANQAR